MTIPLVKTKKYALLIFDWDGTLMDSHGYVMETIKAAAPEQVAKQEGSGLMQAAINAGVSLIEQMRQSQGFDQKFNKSYEDYYFDKFAKTGPQLFPGVLPTLQALKEQGYTLVVATSMSRKSLDTAMQRFQVTEFFAASRCSEETASKPDPMMLYSLLQEFAVPAEHALMIGDTESDMLMAQSAGMDRVAMTTGVHPLDRLQQYDPIACLNDIQKLIELLK